MPKFEITGPDGKKYEVTGPEGSTPEQALAQVQEKSSTPKKETAGMLERFGTGLMDPLVGSAQLITKMGNMPPSVGAGLPTLIGTAAKIGLSAVTGEKNFDEFVRKREAEIKKREPEGINWARMGGNVASTLVPGTLPMKAIGALEKGAGLATRLFGGAAGGATAAALEPTIDKDFMQGKVIQTGVGALAGTATSAVGAAASKGIKEVGAYLTQKYPESIMEHTVQAVLKRIEQGMRAGGPSAKDAIDLVNAANAKGLPTVLADVSGESTRALAGQAFRKQGAGRDFTRSFLEGRDKQAPTILERAIDKFIHGGPTMRDTTEALFTARSAAARPLWDQVRQMEGIWNPRLQQFINDPAIRSGMAKGFEIDRLESLAAKRPFNPTQMGVDLDAQGNIKILKVPNMRALDMARQGLDAMIATERNELTGRLSARGVAFVKARDAYVAELDSLDTSGIYRQARASWAGYSESLDAVRSGRTMFGRSEQGGSKSPQEIAQEFAALSPGNQEFYRVGVSDYLREKVLSAGLNADETKALVKSEWIRQKLLPIFRSPQEFDEFADVVSQLGRQFRTKFEVTGGPQTAARRLEDAEGAIGTRGADLGSNLAHGHYWYAAINAIKMWREKRSDMGPEINEAIAKILFNTKFDPAAEMTQRLKGTFPGKSANYLLGPAAKAGQTGQLLAPGVGSALSKTE